MNDYVNEDLETGAQWLISYPLVFPEVHGTRPAKEARVGGQTDPQALRHWLQGKTPNFFSHRLSQLQANLLILTFVLC